MQERVSTLTCIYFMPKSEKGAKNGGENVERRYKYIAFEERMHSPPEVYPLSGIRFRGGQRLTAATLHRLARVLPP